MSETSNASISSRLGSSNGSSEGLHAEKSGPTCRETLDVINEYKEAYQSCLKQLNECSDEHTKEFLKPLQQILSHLWEQNEMLLKANKEIEEEARKQMKKLQRRLEQKQSLTSLENNTLQEQVSRSSADVHKLLKIIKKLKKSENVNEDDYRLNTVPLETLHKILVKREPQTSQSSSLSTKLPESHYIQDEHILKSSSIQQGNERASASAFSNNDLAKKNDNYSKEDKHSFRSSASDEISSNCNIYEMERAPCNCDNFKEPPRKVNYEKLSNTNMVRVAFSEPCQTITVNMRCKQCGGLP